MQTLAAEHRIDLSAVPGTGLGGRITRKDVLAYLENGGAEAVQPVPAHLGAAGAGQAGRQVPEAQQPALQAVQSQEQQEPVRNSGLHLSESPRIPTIEVEGGLGSSSST